MLIVVALVMLLGSKPPQTIDLIGGHDWSHFAGASASGDGINILPLNRTIVDQDGTNRPNPPVNLAGPSLTYKGDFKIELSTNGFVSGAAFRLYEGVPIVYDEWRYEPASLEIKNEGNITKISLWNGKDSSPVTVRKYPSLAAPKKLSIEKHNNQVTLYADGKLIFEFNAAPVFESGRLWIGLSAEGNQSFHVASMKLQAESDTVKLTDGLTDSVSKQVTSGRIKFGAAVALSPLLTDAKYRNLALNKFNIWTPENELKAQFIHPQQKVYSFNEADFLVNTAIKNNIAIHGHALVFGEANPRWIRNAPADKLQAIMTDHITTVMSHFKGRVNEWDVINEPLSDEDADYQASGNGLRRHIWYNAMGQGYITTALRAAHSADSNAKLYINDYGLEADGPRWEAMLRLVDSLQSANVPLDGVGFEAHIHEAGDRIDPEVLSWHMQELANRGLIARISEIDVFGEDGTSQQAKDYTMVLNVCLKQPNCVAYSSWGITDKYGSTTEYDTYPLEFGNDLMWDSSFKPKLAYLQVRKILNSSR